MNINFCRTILYQEEFKLRGDLAYKIITGKENVKVGDFFEFSDTGYNLRGHCYKLDLRDAVIWRSDATSLVNVWKQLPNHIVKAQAQSTLLSTEYKYNPQFAFQIFRTTQTLLGPYIRSYEQ